MNRAIRVFQDFAGASFKEALQAATTNPGKLLRRDGICTAIAPGQPANLVIFHEEFSTLHVEKVFLQGEPVYSMAN